jgi:hypothetical protein
MRQKRQYLTAREAPEAGPYDEFPTFPPGIDPQLCLSRNDRPQPFFLICEHDTVIVHMSGSGRVEFKGAPVNYHTLEPGDFVYVPARTPHRIVPATPSVQYRFKPEHPGLEGVCWYCERCGAELARDIWDTARELPQEGYLRSCRAFNDTPALRTCKSCGAVHPAIDLAGYRWAEIAAQIRSGAAAEQPEPAPPPR